MEPIEVKEEKLLSNAWDYITKKNIPPDSVLSVVLSILVSILRNCDDPDKAVNQTIDFLKKHVP